MKSFFKTLLICTFAIGLFAACTKGADNTELKNKVDAISAELNTLKAQQQAMQTVIEAWKAGGYVQSIDNSVPGQHTITFYGENGKTVVIYDGQGGDSFFKNIATTEDGVTFTLADETSFTIPFVKAFKLVIENPSAEVEAGQVVNFPYEVKNANASTTVEVFAGGNYQAAVNAAEKKIVVTAPDPATSGSVLAWAQNEEGLFSMRKISFIVKADVEIKTQVDDYQGISVKGGEVTVKLVSNVDIKVASPEVDWVQAALTKANYTLSLTLAENTTGEPRETTIKILRADNDAQVQEIKIIQLGEDKEPGPLDSNVKWTIVDSAYDKVNTPQDGPNVLNVTYGGEKYTNVDHVKLGTAKKPGKITLTLPAGTVCVSFWAVGWKGYDGLLKITELGKTITAPKDDGMTGMDFNISVSDDDKFWVELPQALAEDTVVNVETVLDGTAPAGLRVTLFGIMAYDKKPVKKMTVADIKALCTSKTKVNFEGDFDGMYVNYVLGNQHIYLEDATGAIRFYLGSGNTLKVGTKLSGKISGSCLLDDSSRPQIATLDWWTNGGKKEDDMQAEMPQPMTGTLAEFTAMDIKDIIFRRVKLENVVLGSTVSAKGQSITITDDTGSYTLYINCELGGNQVPQGYKVSGTGTFDLNGGKACIKLHSLADVTSMTPPNS